MVARPDLLPDALSRDTGRSGGSAAAQQATTDLLLAVRPGSSISPAPAGSMTGAAALAPALKAAPGSIKTADAEAAPMAGGGSGTGATGQGGTALAASPGSGEASPGTASGDAAQPPAPVAAASPVESMLPFIVFLNEAPGSGDVTQRAAGLLRSLGAAGQPGPVFDQLNGFVLRITPQQAQRLRALGGVRSVEADAAVFLEPPIAAATTAATPLQPQALNPSALVGYGNATAASGETLPWGVRAVWQGEDISLRGNVAADAHAFVIDSGVLGSTGDLSLASNSTWHRSWISGETAFTDGNGHGTHVAGTIAALANGRGVVGVAPGAQVVSLKVFDSSGGGASYSTIIDAINHATAVINTNALNKSRVVINMSLGGGFSSSLDTAVRNAANQGIRFALAAGNEGQDADGVSPAAAGDHPGVLTVSAVDSSYVMASWSNWDQLDGVDTVDDVDVAAPGVGVLSYYRNGQLASLSGTSMAAPHVAGLLLMGGVRAGDAVTPTVAGRADPFAWAADGTTPEPPPQSDLVLWGSTGNDAITGAGGNDRLSGVLASGTTATAMGAAQIDVLTGGAGSDTFLLGDGRGVFYDDRSRGSLGTADYARILDFTSGVDRLQLRRGNYLLSAPAAGPLSLHWDRNGNGRLDSSGSNQDELIAVLEGLTGLPSSDVVWV